MVKSSRLLVSLIATLVSVAAFANDAPPTDESIAEMMRLSHAEDNFAALKPQVEIAMRKTLDETAGGRSLSEAQRVAYERGRERMVAVMATRYNWDSMREIYLRIYQATFTQDELNGIVAFYRSPAGAAFVNKTPLLQQNLLRETQDWMRPMIKEFQAIAEQTRKEMDLAPPDPK
jgi:hypothetical protein